MTVDAATHEHSDADADGTSKTAGMSTAPGPTPHVARSTSRCAGAQIGRAWLPVVLALAMAAWPITARGDGDLDRRVQAVLAGPGDPAQAGVWFGTPGAPIYQLAADRAMPAASVVKTAILIELFAAHAGHLDDPLGAAADAIVADDKHAAMAPFSAAQRKEIRTALHGATVRTVGAIMMGSQKASNPVYNAAANLIIAALGGPAGTTAKIHARDPGFAGVIVGRYMLASRTAGDNEATPASLAAVLAAVATARVPGVDATTAGALAQVMMQSKDPALGVHRHKDGNLDSDPMVCIKTGFYLRRNDKPPLIYVVGASLSARPTGSRDAAHNRLDKLTDALHAALRTAAP
ncbi:MAG: hypothetical protein E6J90_03410 [Deltaproteobacteria bacterium]|nr:MAG: hypothetical protein E6J91_18045 [Deltaproteobacteria bacterium]TMQ26986.1 MAG: hypothetical protein E6J90_03410 [Deltaproteobacteria bacterium]